MAPVSDSEVYIPVAKDILNVKMTSQGREVGKQKKAHREEEGSFGVPLGFWLNERPYVHAFQRRTTLFATGCVPCWLTPPDSYPKIESKRTRPHVMVLVHSYHGTWFAWPLRPSIKRRCRYDANKLGLADSRKCRCTVARPLLRSSHVDLRYRSLPTSQ